MTNLEFLDDLIGLMDVCLRSGMVKVERYESCTQITIPHHKGYATKDTYKHFFKIVPVSIKHVCWTTPYRSKKNLDKLTMIRNKYKDYFYLVVEPYSRGNKIKIKCYDVFGIKRKTFRIKLFSINIGRETVSRREENKPNKKNLKNKNKKSKK